MCIVADKVNDVKSTRIVSFHVAYNRTNRMQDLIAAQLVVYAANIDSIANSNALILPVYNPGNNIQNIIILDFIELHDFITEIDNYFQRWYPRKISYSSTTNGYTNSGKLMVHQVGNYKFSVLPSRFDFDKIDNTQLHVDASAKISIDVHSNDYSFIVYQFYDSGNLNIEPFAYLCKPYTDNSLMIPTIHGHPHSLNSVSPNYFIGDFANNRFENNADFDHEIYVLTKKHDKLMHNNKDIVDLNKILRKITMDYQKKNIRVYAPLYFSTQKVAIHGTKPNRNILFDNDKYQFMEDLQYAPLNQLGQSALSDTNKYSDIFSTFSEINY